MVVARWSHGGRAVVARWSNGGRAVVDGGGCVSSRERIFSSSVRVCGGSVVVAQWFCGGRAVVARWSHGGRAVVVPSSRGGCCVSSRERLFSSSVCVCGGSVVVARWFWWSRGGSGGRAVVTRWLRFCVANYSVHLLFVCAVVLW